MSDRLVDRNREIKNVRDYFNTQSYHFSSDWVHDCANFFLSEHEINNGNRSELFAFVKAQWLLLDFRDFGIACLPANLKSQGRVTLPGKYVLQLQSIKDISVSCYSQYQALKKVDVENVNVQENREAFQLPKANRMFMMELTDGMQTIFAVEDEPINHLAHDLVPGIKVMIVGPVRSANGRLRLINRNVHVLGGEVESLVNVNAYENILGRALGLPENPDPHNLHPPEVKPKNNWDAVTYNVNEDDEHMMNEQFAAHFQGEEDDSGFNELNNHQTSNRNVPLQQIDNPAQHLNHILTEQRANTADVAEQRSSHYNNQQHGNRVAPCNDVESISLLSDDEDFLQSIDDLEKKVVLGVILPVPPRQPAANQTARTSFPSLTTNQPLSKKELRASTSNNVLNQVVTDTYASTSSISHTNRQHSPQSPLQNEADSIVSLLDSEDDDTWGYLQSIDELEMKAAAGVILPPTLPRQLEANQTACTSYPSTTNQLPIRNQPQNLPQPSTSKNLFNRQVVETTKLPDATSSGRVSKGRPTSHVPTHKNTKQTKLSFQKLASPSWSPDLNSRPKVEQAISSVLNVRQDYQSMQKQQPVQPTVKQENTFIHADKNLTLEQLQALKYEPVTESNTFDATEPWQASPPTRSIVQTSTKPWVYLTQISDLQPTTTRRIYTVKAIVMTLVSKVAKVNNGWYIEGEITDGSAIMKVSFSSDVLEKLVGFSPREMRVMTLEMKTNPLIKEKIYKGFSNAQDTLLSLDCLMSIELCSDLTLPRIMKLTDVTVQNYDDLRTRLNSLASKSRT